MLALITKARKKKKIILAAYSPIISLPPPILTTFYRGIIESVLTSCITVWYRNCSAADRKTLQRTVNTAAKIIGAPLPCLITTFELSLQKNLFMYIHSPPKVLEQWGQFLYFCCKLKTFGVDIKRWIWDERSAFQLLFPGFHIWIW